MGFRLEGGTPERLGSVPQERDRQMGRACQARWACYEVDPRRPDREGCMRLRLFAAAAAAAALFGSPGIAAAQTYPDKPVRMVVAFGAGGTLDTLARIVSAEAQRHVEAAGRGREPRRRRRQYRRGASGAGDARRLYAAFRRADAGGERHDPAAQGFRSGARSRAGDFRRHRAGRADGAAAVPGEDGAGADRHRQEAPGRAELRLRRPRHLGPSRHRAVLASSPARASSTCRTIRSARA